MFKGISAQRMKKIDPISYTLWQRFVKPFVGRSVVRTKAMRLLLLSGPTGTCSHPVIRMMVRSGLGMDGLNAAMMTWGYLASICRYHEIALRKSRE